MKKTAIIITGAPCSGKTTICNKLFKDTGIDCFNENNSGNLNGIINKLNDSKDFVIIEHSDILNYIDKIKNLFDKIIIIYLDVSDELLMGNYEQRIKNNSVGDFKNVDILKIKNEISLFFKTSNLENLFLIEIKSISDYDRGYEVIKQIIEKEKTN